MTQPHKVIQSRITEGRDIPDKDKLVKRIQGLCKSVKRWKDGFLDLEAEVDDDGQSLSSYGEYDRNDEDKYDSTDSFMYVLAFVKSRNDLIFRSDDSAVKGHERCENDAEDPAEEEEDATCDGYVPGLE
jgi:hypothetical protein